MTKTRERFIDAATKAFADRGFYGTSIAAISDALPYTKQALLHHFGSKEKLYAEVLKRISERLMHELSDVRERHLDPRERLEETFAEIYRSAVEHRDDTQLLMRELLDNKRRAETARTWYLKHFLDTLADMVMDVTTSESNSRHNALSFVYQVLGAINYFAVSEPTLARMLGRQDFSKLRAGYEADLRALISARIDLLR